MEQLICQSCGMPLEKEDQFGTNADKTPNEEYCSYCFQDGEFTNDCSMEEIIQLNVQYLDEYNKDAPVPFNKDQAISYMRDYFPSLKRWKR